MALYGIGAVGSMLHLGCRGREFKSRIPYQRVMLFPQEDWKASAEMSLVRGLDFKHNCQKLLELVSIKIGNLEINRINFMGKWRNRQTHRT